MSNLENPIHTYSDYGLYEVCLSVINDCDTSVICDTVEVVNSGLNENFISKMNIYPNPLKSTTTISYELLKPEKISLEIYNHYGQEVWQMIEDQQRGKQKIVWDANDLAEGIYYYRLKVGDAVVKGKIIKE